MNLHIRTIHERIYFDCKICHRKFSQEGALKGHINRIHKQVTQFKFEVSSENCEMEGNESKIEKCSLDMAVHNQSTENFVEHEQISKVESKNDVGIPKTNAKLSMLSSLEFFEDTSETQEEPIYLYEDPLADALGVGTVQDEVQDEEKSYTCTFCGKCFSSDEALITHVASFICH